MGGGVMTQGRDRKQSGAAKGGDEGQEWVAMRSSIIMHIDHRHGRFICGCCGGRRKVRLPGVTRGTAH